MSGTANFVDSTKNSGLGDDSTTALYGRTNSGKVFSVPKTTDMLTTLFMNSRKRSVLTWTTLFILGFEMYLFFTLSTNVRKLFFLVLFLFWRVGYNGFLGILLQKQSQRGYIVRLLSRRGFLDDKLPWGKFVKKQLTEAMGPDYDFNQVPSEFNAWLLFRELVDLILVNDFGTYIMFALSYFQARSDWTWWENGLRYIVAFLLLAFNVAVKVDAHRVVKDFAWYWGDFFFLVDQSLTFDGVFELAPHPMYSVGYAGYYGISIFTASTTVFYVSLLAHAAQFLFLVIVENPHIEKTYPSSSKEPEVLVSKSINGKVSKALSQAYFSKDVSRFFKFDLHRAPDMFGLMVLGYGISFPLISFLHDRVFPSKTFISIVVLAHGLAWRLFYTLGLGFGVLAPQSTKKTWTRHFIKTGETPEVAFSHWLSIYSLTSAMSYISYGGAALYHIQIENWSIGSLLLRFTCGMLLVLLHIWTSLSVIEELGTFGWSYGDFFLDPRPTTLRYTGIYRYLNNPEKILGQSALYGLALISFNPNIFTLAILSHMCHLAVHYKIEVPHMRSRYHGLLRSEAGVTKTVKGAARQLTANLAGARALAAVKGAEALIDKVGQSVDQALAEARSRIPDLVGETQTLLTTSKKRLAETRNRLIQDLVESSYQVESNPSDIYQLELEKFPQEESTSPAQYLLGEPILLRVTVPAGVNRKWDWVGIYPVVSNPSKLISTVSSKNCFLYTHPPHFNSQADLGCPDDHSGKDQEFFGDVYERSQHETPYYIDFHPSEDLNTLSVTLIFSGSRLPWAPGTYEFRCHRGPGHGVASISRPFEIKTPLPLVLPSSANEVVSALLIHLPSCLEVDHVASDLDLTSLNKSQASKIASIIKSLFLVEFEPEVISSHSDLSGLGQRIIDARTALAPFSIPSSKASPESSDEVSLPEDETINTQ